MLSEIMDSFSAFPFENYLGKVKKLVRKQIFVLEQVILRLRERKIMHIQLPVQESNRFVNELRRSHTNGPVPNDVNIDLLFTQYKVVVLRNFSITLHNLIIVLE